MFFNPLEPDNFFELFMKVSTKVHFGVNGNFEIWGQYRYLQYSITKLWNFLNFAVHFLLL